MSFFNDDPFDIFREIMEGRPRNRRSAVIKGEDDERTIDYIESDGYVYLLFELPGYSEKDVSVSVKSKELIITARKRGNEIQSYLRQRLEEGITITRKLPESVSGKKFTHTMHNGILEVTLARK